MKPETEHYNNGKKFSELWRDNNGKKFSELWRDNNGKRHRDGAPALIHYDEHGRKTFEQWYRHGNPIKSPHGYCMAWFNPDGTIHKTATVPTQEQSHTLPEMEYEQALAREVEDARANRVDTIAWETLQRECDIEK